MKKITKLLAHVTLFSAMSFGVHANDGAYYMSGNQLVPMTVPDIDVVREKLDIKRVNDKTNDIDVNVHYELDNQGDAQSMMVGFEAMTPDGDANECPIEGKHPYMKDFDVIINGEKVDYKVATVPYVKIEHDLQKKFAKSSKLYFSDGNIRHKAFKNDCTERAMLFVYYFTADFKKGKNIIDHHYRFKASLTTHIKYSIDYVLTAINRWGDNKVDDFQLTIDMGKNTSFDIANTFFDSEKDWNLEGKIKAYPTPPNMNHFYNDEGKSANGTAVAATTFAVYDGKITFKKQNFEPKGEILLQSPGLLNTYDGTFDAKKDNLSFFYQDQYIYDVDGLNPYSRKIFRNYPFALRGYVFKSKDIQAYYDKQPWYIRDESYKANIADLKKFEQELIQKLKK